MNLVYTLSPEVTQKHHWDLGKKWLDFSDIDFIFKVTPAFWMSNLTEKSLSALYLLNQMMDSGQILCFVSFGIIKVLIRFGDLDLIFKVTTPWRLQKWALSALYLVNQLVGLGDIVFLRKHSYIYTCIYKGKGKRHLMNT